MQFRNLPSVESVMATEALVALAAEYSRPWLVDLVRRDLEQARQAVREAYGMDSE